MGKNFLLILVDIKAYLDYRHLFIFIYDKADHVSNKRAFGADLEKQ
ncbi:hypothetical protein [Pedobacter gandavensis]|nr:hypothetical protein [Pedobacter gandavensis]